MNEELFSNPKYHKLKNFKFTSGEILKEAIVEYITLGTAKYDNNGKITNGILYCHGSSGNFSSIWRIMEIVGKDKVLSIDEYFFISLSTLGSPKSASPSSTKLGNKFPKYTIEDMVNFQKEFLKDKFGIEHLKGLIGNSMGGFEVLTWGVKYPDTVDFIISLVSSYKLGGQNYILSKIIKDIIESDPEYKNGNYDFPLERSLKLISNVTYGYGLSREHYMFNMSNEEINIAMDEFANETLDEDVNDLIYRNNSSLFYDLTDELEEIKAKVLIIAINQDQYFPPELNAIPMSKLIKDSKLIIFDSLNGHIGSNELKKVEKEIVNFFNQL